MEINKNQWKFMIFDDFVNLFILQIRSSYSVQTTCASIVSLPGTICDGGWYVMRIVSRMNIYLQNK